MLKRITTTLILTMAVLFMNNTTDSTAAPRRGPASPQAVSLSPNIAELQVSERAQVRQITPESCEFTLVVPANINQDTFSVRIPGFQVSNLSFKSLLPAADAPDSPRGLLLAKLREAQAEQARLQGRKQALEARLALWTASPSDFNTDSLDLDKLDAGLSSKLPDIYAELAALPELLAEAQQKASFYENELNALGGRSLRLMEVIVSFNGTASGPLEVDYSYYTYGCGWQPLYSFAADPEKNSIKFSQQASIWQNTGLNWEGAAITLSTKAPDFRLAPGNLHPWQLYREEEPRARASGVMYESAVPAPQQEDEAPMAAKVRQQSQAPVSMQRSSHLEWALGGRNIPSGTPVTLTLQEDEWAGEFYYTLRPSLGPESFITAKVKLPEAVELSRGRAVFTLDGRLCGTNNNFAANSDEFELFFGKDDRVTVEMLDLIKQQGKEGFFSTTNTYNWEWKITVSNKRNRDIKIRVEEPMPRAMDSSIKLKTESTPMPEVEKSTWFWKAELPAGQDFVINHKVSATASGSQRLIPGR